MRTIQLSFRNVVVNGTQLPEEPNYTKQVHARHTAHIHMVVPAGEGSTVFLSNSYKSESQLLRLRYREVQFRPLYHILVLLCYYPDVFV
jgi:hypothetical protein